MRPSLRYRLIDREYSISEPGSHLRKPPVKTLCLFRIRAALKFDTAPDFGKDDNTGADVLDRGLGNPLYDVRMRSLPFSNFRNHIRIEEKFQSSTLRQPLWRG